MHLDRVLVICVLNLLSVNALINKPILLASVIPDENEILKGVNLKLPSSNEKTSGVVNGSKSMSEENRNIVQLFWNHLQRTHVSEEEELEFRKLFFDGVSSKFPERGVNFINNKMADRFWEFLDQTADEKNSTNIGDSHRILEFVSRNRDYDSYNNTTEEPFWTYSSDKKKSTKSTTLEPAFSRFWDFVEVNKSTQKTTERTRPVERTRPDDWYRPTRKPVIEHNTPPNYEDDDPPETEKPYKHKKPNNNKPSMQFYEYLEPEEITQKPKDRPTRRTTEATTKQFFDDWDDYISSTRKRDTITERQSTRKVTTNKPKEHYYDDWDDEVTTKKTRRDPPQKPSSFRPPERTTKPSYDEYVHEDVTTQRTRPTEEPIKHTTPKPVKTTKKYYDDWDEDDEPATMNTIPSTQRYSTPRSTESTIHFQDDWDEEEITTKLPTKRTTKSKYDDWDDEPTSSKKPIESYTKRTTTFKTTEQADYDDWDEKPSTTKRTTLRPVKITQPIYADWDEEITTKKPVKIFTQFNRKTKKPIEISTQRSTTVKPTERTTQRTTQNFLDWDDEEIESSKPLAKPDYEYVYEEYEFSEKPQTGSTPKNSHKTTKQYFNIYNNKDDDTTTKKLPTVQTTETTQAKTKKTTRNYFNKYEPDSYHKRTSPQYEPTTSSSTEKPSTPSENEETENFDDWGLPNFDQDDVSKKPETAPVTDDFLDFAPNEQQINFSIFSRGHSGGLSEGVIKTQANSSFEVNSKNETGAIHL